MLRRRFKKINEWSSIAWGLEDVMVEMKNMIFKDEMEL